ncbi:dipeptidase [Virgibacillus flavescens]|uniref:dipeptidase n=1 Tax=Virgibacillus flavescens TaxID=1611422 RepID=UPI003D32A6B0
MKIIDTHCDALNKLQLSKREKAFKEGLLDYKHSSYLHTNLKRLKAGESMAQFFAIFVHPDIPLTEMWQHALEQVDLFYTEIIDKNPGMKHIKSWNEFDTLKEGEIGAVLTLEGAEAIGNDLSKLRHLYRLGIMSMGLTWNNANLCGDGAEEPRGGGLTRLGKQIVKLNNENHVLTDVSHLTDKGFWDVIDLAEFPIASHSNTRALCDNPRNLTDEQIKALFAKNGSIHVVFHPPFVHANPEDVTIPNLVKHIDHLCSLGGVKQVGFGSDFDGTSSFAGLDDFSKYQNLINELLNHYTEDQVKGFAYQNFLDNRPGVK